MRQRHEVRLYARQPSSPLVLGPQGGELDQSRDAFSRVAKMLQVEGLQASACCERCHFRALNGETCEGQIQVAKLCKVSKRRRLRPRLLLPARSGTGQVRQLNGARSTRTGMLRHQTEFELRSR
jgi:hypothetical protein